MSSLNKAMIIGRLGQDPEVRYTQSNTAVANLSVATSERYTDKQGQKVENTEWHRIVVWGRLAEICQEYLKKGSLAYFEGPLQTREWEDKNGVKKYTTEIKALTMQMLDSKGDSNGAKAAYGPPNQAETSPGAKVDGNTDLGNLDDLDDDLPF